MARFTPNHVLPADVIAPGYNPADHGVGIVHIGLGAFHRAHQAVYTDDALASDGGDWRITGVSLRSARVANNINAQHGLYSVLVRGDDNVSLRVIGSIDKAIAVRGNVSNATTNAVSDAELKALFDVLTKPATRIVSLTVTEKAYDIDRTRNGVNLHSPAIKRDLMQSAQSESVIGILVHALGLRRENNVPPFTVLCCDNMPANGHLLRAGTLDYAQHLDAALARHIEQHVSFPSTMVDRITPAISADVLTEIASRLGAQDHAAVETEPFSQWVVEDQFPSGRPLWEAGGALFVADVEPYEMMKLRMLNGAHSFIAYAGYLAGMRYVRDAMVSEDMLRWIRAHFTASARTLNPVAGIDYSDYAKSLEARFANRSIAHETYQIAMDATEKLPQRIFAPALHALQHDQPIATYAFATAAWLRYCSGVDEQARPFALRDPREAEISKALLNVPMDAGSLYRAVTSLPSLIPDELGQQTKWQAAVLYYLNNMLETGMTATLACAVNMENLK